MVRDGQSHTVPRAFQTLSGSYAGCAAERSGSVDWSSRCGHGRPLGKLAMSQKLETTSDCNPQKTILRDLSSMILLCHALPGHSSDASYACDVTVQEATALKVYLLLKSFAKNHEKPGVRHSSRAVLLASVYEFTGFRLQNPSRTSGVYILLAYLNIDIRYTAIHTSQIICEFVVMLCRINDLNAA